MRLSIGNDHGALLLKSAILDHLATHHPSITVIDQGVNTPDSVHYPDFADAVAINILSGNADVGILLCGTGIGIGIRANRYPGIRAALVYDLFTAEMAKAHNNANILCLGGRTTTPEVALTLIDKWLSTPFEGGRHQSRIDMLDAPLKSAL
jgi:ribose 5-phosphate isomerase B